MNNAIMVFGTRHMNITRHLTVLFVVLLPAVSAGCAGFQWIDWNKTKVVEATANNPVSRIICIWEPAEGHGLDGLPTRGVAGQILFFTKQHPQPVMVEGDVRVYLFNDRGPPEERSKPIHQFEFLGDAWTVHAQHSSLGPAYNVFIPYVRKNNEQVTCGLQIRLTPKAGPTMFSQMVHVTLPGSIDDEQQKQRMGSSATNEILTRKSGMDTTSLGAVVKKERVSFVQEPPAKNVIHAEHVAGESTPVRNHEPSTDAAAGHIQLAGFEEPAATPTQNAAPLDVQENKTLTSPVSKETMETSPEKPRSHRLAPVVAAEWEEEPVRKPHPLDDVPMKRHPLLDDTDESE